MSVRTSVTVPAGTARLAGDLAVPEGARGVVLFAHGSGSGRHSPRNRHVAAALGQAGLATLLLDLLTEEEEAVDRDRAELRFDIALLAGRLAAAMDWLREDPRTSALPIGLFGASTGAAAALVVAAERPLQIAAVVSRGGRPDLAGPSLGLVRAPTPSSSASSTGWRSCRRRPISSRSPERWSGSPRWPPTGSGAGWRPIRARTAKRATASRGGRDPGRGDQRRQGAVPARRHHQGRPGRLLPAGGRRHAPPRRGPAAEPATLPGGDRPPGLLPAGGVGALPRLGAARLGPAQGRRHRRAPGLRRRRHARLPGQPRRGDAAHLDLAGRPSRAADGRAPQGQAGGTAVHRHRSQRLGADGGGAVLGAAQARCAGGHADRLAGAGTDGATVVHAVGRAQAPRSQAGPMAVDGAPGAALRARARASGSAPDSKTIHRLTIWTFAVGPERASRPPRRAEPCWPSADGSFLRWAGGLGGRPPLNCRVESPSAIASFYHGLAAVKG